LESVSFFTGGGKVVQAGGYKIKDGYGIDLSKNVIGSHNYLGIPF